LLGEKVGPRRLAGVAAGFLGALIITRPGFGVLQLAAFLPIGAACCYSVYQILTRSITSTDSPMTTFAYTAVVGTVVTTIALPSTASRADLATETGRPKRARISATQASSRSAVLPQTTTRSGRRTPSSASS